jgi:hypothetical protein
MLSVLPFLGFTAACAAFTGVHVLATMLAGVRIERVSLFFGPELLSWRIGRTRAAIGLIPSGAYLQPDQEAMDRLPVLQRVAILLSAPMVLLAAGWMLCGGAVSPGHALERLVAGALHPRLLGGPMLRAWDEQVRHGRLLASCGRLLLAFAMLNLVPLPATSAGQALALALGRGPAGSPRAAWWQGLLIANLLLLVAFGACWAAAYVLA